MPLIRPVRPAKTRTLVAVCAKCDGDPKAVRRELKRELKKHGEKGAVRVVATSCLDLCPKRSVAIAVAGERSGEAGLRYYVVSDDADPRDVFSQITSERAAAAEEADPKR